jgi:hypothetical protein
MMQKLQPIFAIFLAWLLLKRATKKFFIMPNSFIWRYFIAFPTLAPNFNTGDKTTIGAFLGFWLLYLGRIYCL